MMSRWKSSNKFIPKVDQYDIHAKNQYLKQKLKDRNKQLNQHHPEFTQTSYLRLRSLEEAFAMKNYMDPKNTQEQHEKLSQNKAGRKKVPNHLLISQFDRSYAIQKIFDLHIKKDYKIETLFIACSILDRYLYSIGW